MLERNDDHLLRKHHRIIWKILMSFETRLDYVLSEMYANKNTIVFHGTTLKALPDTLRNGLGGEGKGKYHYSGIDPAHSGEYITRHLGVALEYAHEYSERSEDDEDADYDEESDYMIGSPPVVLALEWSNPSEFDWDEDEDEHGDDVYYAGRERNQYTRSNYVAPRDNLKIIYAWVMPNAREETTIPFSPWNPETRRPIGGNEKDRISHEVFYLSGNAAVSWLDKHGKLVYNGYDRNDDHHGPGITSARISQPDPPMRSSAQKKSWLKKLLPKQDVAGHTDPGQKWLSNGSNSSE